MSKKLLLYTVFIFLLVFIATFVVLAQIGPRLLVTDDDSFVVDANGNQLADPNDVIRYTVVIANCGDETAENVVYNSTIDANTVLIPNSITLSDLQATNTRCGQSPTNPPAPPPGPPPVVDALAASDIVNVTNGGTVNQNISVNDWGSAPLQVLTFGDSIANVATFAADGMTVGSFPAGGGTLDVTIDATGNLSVTANGTTGTGTVTIFYEIQAANGTTDIGQITISFGDFPAALDDTLATLGAGNEYSTNTGVTLTIAAATGVLNNDTPGTPAATLTFWGGGDASPSVNRAPGTSRPLAGGTLTVNADGSFTLTNPTTPGVYTFDYIIDNGLGTSQATVEIYVSDPPIAQDDTVNASIAQINTYTAPALFNDNGNGLDYLGAPPATITFFGGGSFGGAVTDNATGATIAIPVLGGTLTVNADGSFVVTNPTVAGTFTFQYRLDNGIGTSDATVTVNVVATPTAFDDDLSVILPANLTADLTVDNGNGADDPGVPAFTSLTFGGGSLGGTVTDNNGGASIALAGGTLTVTNAGAITLNGATIPGTYTFEYQLTNANGTGNIATVTIEVQDAPVALADAINAVVAQVTNIAAGAGLFVDNGSGADSLGTPVATLVSFGGGNAPGTVVTNAAGATVAFAGGTLTVNADGSLSISNPTMNGTFTFDYRIQNVVGFSDATVTVTISQIPIAADDAYSFLLGVDQTVAAGAGLFVDNGSGVDSLGNPVATLTSFGGGSLGGVVTNNAAGASVALAGGTLTVNADGSWSLTGQPFTPGTYTFDYRLTNTSGTSDATVTLIIQDPPIAQADAINAVVAQVTNIAAGTGLFVDNGSGADTLGTPAATLVSFGGGNAPGTVVTNAAGATVAFAGGTLTVNTDGSLSISNPTMNGTFTFDYRIQNVVGFSDATVTVTISQIPIAADDAYSFLLGVDQTVAAGAGLFVDNGSGADNLGNPVATLTSFGGGSLGGVVTNNAAGASVALAGGTLTVNANGSWSLTGQPFTPGTYTFDYRLTNTSGTSDATVTLIIADPPIALADAISAITGQVTNIAAGAGLFVDNGSGADTLGTPAATLVSFGGGDAPGTVVTNAAGATVAFAGGTLTVNADGSLTISNPTMNGTFTFDYRIQNVAGFSDATVTVTIQAPPDGFDDTAATVLAGTSTVGSTNFHLAQNISSNAVVNAYVDNGFGADIPGLPSAPTDAPADAINTVILAGVANGATGIIGGGAISLGASGSIEITAAGAINITPPTNFVGLIEFDYTLANSIGTDATPATVTFAFGNPPVCAADAYAATGNVAINTTTVANNSVLFNDNGDQLVLTAVQGAAGNIAMNTATTQMGTVNVAATGEFVYTPPTGFTGDDTFTYSINNGFNNPSQCTVTITVTNLIFFMDSAAGAGGDGSLAAPYRTIAEHNGAAPPANNYLYIDDNGAAYNGNLTLVSGQTVIGQGSSGTLFGGGSRTGITLAPLSVTMPYSLTNNTNDWAQIANAAGSGITLNTGNTISGISVGNTSNYGIIDSGASAGTSTITETGISNGTAGALAIRNGGALDYTFSNLSATGTGFDGILLNNVTGSVTVPYLASNDLTMTNGACVNIVGAAARVALDMQFDTCTTTNSPTNGMRLENVSGTQFRIENATNIDMNGGNEGIRIVNATTTLLDISDGSTVTVADRNTTGAFIDTTSSTNVNFGNLTVANPNGATGYGMRIEDSSAAFDFDQTNISNSVVGTAQTQAADFPTNDGDGDNIFLSNNTGSTTIRGGLLNNAGGENLDARNSSNVVLLGMTIEDAAGMQVALYNSPGTHEVRNTTIQNFGVVVAPPVDGHGYMLRNNNVNANLIFDANTVQANIAGGGGTGLLVESRGTSVFDVDIIGNNIFENIFATGAQIVAQGGTVNTLVEDTTFRNSNGTGSGALVIAADGGGSHTHLIQNNTFQNLGQLDSASGILAVSSFNGATSVGMITGNSLSNTRRNMLQVQTETNGNTRLQVTDNDFNNLIFTTSENRAAMFISSQGANSVDLDITNNRIGQATTVATEGVVLTGVVAGTVRANISSNTIGGATQMRGRGIGLDFPNAGNYQLTINNNTINAGSLASFFRRDITVEVEGSATACANMTGNALNGDGLLGIDEAGASSTIAVSTHANAAAVSTANNTATVQTGGTINYSAAACTTPSGPYS